MILNSFWRETYCVEDKPNPLSLPVIYCDHLVALGKLENNLEVQFASLHTSKQAFFNGTINEIQISENIGIQIIGDLE